MSGWFEFTEPVFSSALTRTGMVAQPFQPASARIFNASRFTAMPRVSSAMPRPQSLLPSGVYGC